MDCIVKTMALDKCYMMFGTCKLNAVKYFLKISGIPLPPGFTFNVILPGYLEDILITSNLVNQERGLF